MFIQRVNIDQVSDTRWWEVLVFVINYRPQYGQVFDNLERFILMVVRIVIQFPFYNINTLEVKRDVGSYLSFMCIVIEWCKCYWLVMYYVLPRYSFSMNSMEIVFIMFVHPEFSLFCLQFVNTSWRKSILSNLLLFIFICRIMTTRLIYLHIHRTDVSSYLQTFCPSWVSDLLLYTASDYPFAIFKLSVLRE